ncbi:hypothetical protein BSFA1_22580 [Burkholderia sp. SFA1]|nr:hypothetical protein BSFA1_22580 [Burkholderia sp. SFA1]
MPLLLDETCCARPDRSYNGPLSDEQRTFEWQADGAYGSPQLAGLCRKADARDLCKP